VVEKAADWRWSRLWHRVYGDKEGLLDEGPLTLPSRWRGHVQRGQTETEREALRRSVVRGAPLGESSRQERTAKKLGLLFDAPPRWPPAENATHKKKTIAVGTAVAGGPPHRSVHEALPHTAPALSRARNRWFG